MLRQGSAVLEQKISLSAVVSCLRNKKWRVVGTIKENGYTRNGVYSDYFRPPPYMFGKIDIYWSMQALGLGCCDGKGGPPSKERIAQARATIKHL